MLLQILTVILVLANSAAENEDRHSISGEFGSAAGTSFSYSGPHLWGPITAFRVWEYPYYYIYGIQLQFAHRWSESYGLQRGTKHEVTLFRGERITQVSGKHSTYIYQLIISTSHKRIFFFGQPYGTCFNALPLDRTDVLSFLSGHHNGAGITGLMMHWAEPKRRE
ncbi:zymogen granule membrane protein 16-like [Emydura macquarii macquarii]|uniref:zymogen granule membrane protein 16-like n=1 Tax=Emydura macquarii macquarii TaxID=1129001 RepID=UPI00352A8D81